MKKLHRSDVLPTSAHGWQGGSCKVGGMCPENKTVCETRPTPSKGLRNWLPEPPEPSDSSLLLDGEIKILGFFPPLQPAHCSSIPLSSPVCLEPSQPVKGTIDVNGCRLRTECVTYPSNPRVESSPQSDGVCGEGLSTIRIT